MPAVRMLKSSCVSPLWSLCVASRGGSQPTWAEVTLKCVWGCLEAAASLTGNEGILGLQSSAAINFVLHLHSSFHVARLCISLLFVWSFLFRLSKYLRPNYIKASFVPLSAGYDFCAEGLICGENSECKNRNTKAECECRSGYASIHGDATYCEGTVGLLVHAAKSCTSDRMPAFQLLFCFDSCWGSLL